MHSSIKIWVPNFELPIEVGILDDDEEEKIKMYQLRYKVYAEQRGYIPKELLTNGLDIDDYDKDKKCVYVAAKYGDNMIGSLRIIKDNPLPIIDHYFYFTDDYIKNVEPEKLVEIGRLISLGKSELLPFFPRHLVALGMFFVMGSYLKENNTEVLYGALKEYIYKKFNKLKLPMVLIKPYTQIFDATKTEDPLKNFFNQPNDPVVPVRVLVNEGNIFMHNLFEKSPVFKKKGSNEYVYRGDLLFSFYILKRKFFY